ncbi:MAG: NADP-dependent isocitrate dehydrogenase, partial [Cyclobacteriaceae bacterium]
GNAETFCTDHWRCRFVNNGEMLTNSQIIDLLGKVQSSDFDFIKTENLYTFDGVTGYSLGQGE